MTPYIFLPLTNGMEKEVELFFTSVQAAGYGEYLPVPLGMVEVGHRAYAYLTLQEVPDVLV